MSDAAAAVLFAEVRAKMDGVAYGRHAILTCGGTWAPDGVGYASDTVARADPTLCYEVIVPGPQSFGPIGGNVAAPSYDQSVNEQYQNGIAILQDHFGRGQTCGIWGYSQGGQVASMLAMACMTGQLSQYEPLFIGGGTYGNPYRLADSVAPGYANPGAGTHGIAPTNMTAADIKRIAGRSCWADYCNPHDLYTTSPPGQVGVIEADAYTLATAVQMNDMIALVEAEVNACLKIVADALGSSSSTAAGPLGALTSLLTGGIGGILTLGVGVVTGLLTGLISGPQANATGVQAAAEAALNGIEFLAMNPPTAPHISYEGENGYPDAVGMGAAFLNEICTLTLATAA